MGGLEVYASVRTPDERCYDAVPGAYGFQIAKVLPAMTALPWGLAPFWPAGTIGSVRGACEKLADAPDSLRSGNLRAEEI
jgi:hypothetical protein